MFKDLIVLYGIYELHVFVCIAIFSPEESMDDTSWYINPVVIFRVEGLRTASNIWQLEAYPCKYTVAISVLLNSENDITRCT